MVQFRGLSSSFTLGQSTQFYDKADYMLIPSLRREHYETLVYIGGMAKS